MGQVLGVCYLLSYHRCNVSAVVDSLSLYPPNPPYYILIQEEEKISGTYGMFAIENRIPDDIDVTLLHVSGDIAITVMHYKVPNSKRVIIYSHPNAVDLGCFLSNIKSFADSFETSYIIYDYEGYGCSDGDAQGKNLLRDVRAVYNYAKTLYSTDQIFLYGESKLVGSVPTCYLASELCQKFTEQRDKGFSPAYPLAGIILHAGLYSGSKFPCGCLIKKSDPYNNAHEMQYISCPVFHIHGTNDITVPFKYGSKLFAISKSSFEPWWVQGGGHSTIIAEHFDEYSRRMKLFLEFCKEHHGRMDATPIKGNVEGQDGNIQSIRSEVEAQNSVQLPGSDMHVE